MGLVTNGRLVLPPARGVGSTEAPTVLLSGVYAGAFDADGRGALASTAMGLYRSDDGSH